jgi:hypothetical protein
MKHILKGDISSQVYRFDLTGFSFLLSLRDDNVVERVNFENGDKCIKINYVSIPVSTDNCK